MGLLRRFIGGWRCQVLHIDWDSTNGSTQENQGPDPCSESNIPAYVLGYKGK